ncbi:alpha/beta hydrolase [Antrihabitans sp. YC2-6]|uniref:alpha/beta hydrolase n=1 Tax=Antrihabitans sp. YC2-6 TaxID=2799498 RepID=UPI0018F69E76|nr:alpha/beta fold hydrolase [Antrihabitans sp. YC2-6]MBJ8343572.1 alpha/beta fold hydrolase [Antrihabitans sp. YC2-6]
MPFFDGVSGRVHYRTWAVETPAAVLVFLHGSRQHTGDYHRFARASNARGIEVWALDHVGHGLSEGEPDQLAPLSDLAENAWQLVELARKDRSVVLMGHSLGSATALVALQSRTAGIAAAVLCGTPKSVVTLRAPVIPTLLVHGVDDRLAPIDPIREWVDRQTGVELREYVDAGHDLLHEPVHSVVTADVAEFVLGRSVRSGHADPA